MKTIRISEDVWEAMAKRGKFGETPDDVLRREFGIKEPSKRMSKLSRALLPPEDTSCKMEYKGTTIKGVIDGGQLVLYRYGRFNSLSDAACKVSKVSLNGWLYWWFKLPGQSKWISADGWRRRKI